jgi:hypothetical protein
MSSFDLTEVEVEFLVGESFEDSKITAFRHKRSGKELDFGIVGTWLVDAEGQFDVAVPERKKKIHYASILA